MDHARGVMRSRLLVAALALATSVDAAPVFAETAWSLRSWRSQDTARYLRDMREAARRRAKSAERQKKDAARARREALQAAREIKAEARRIAAERTAAARRARLEWSASMREYKRSLAAQSWRKRSRI